MLAGALLLAQLSIAVTAPDTVRWRESIPVRVIVQVPGREAPRVIAPPLRGLTIAATMENARLDLRPGGPWVEFERKYDLRARRPGTYVIPSFEARLAGEHVTSRPAIVTVVATGDTTPPAVVARAHLDPSAHVNFRAIVIPDTVFVGQQASYQVGVFIDDEVRYRLRRNPEFVPPEPRSMMVYELRPRAVDYPPRVEGGNRYEVHAFERALFPLTAGRFVIPPAELVYSLPLTASFFSRSESFALHSESLAVVVRELPDEGKPADFDGAVGRIDSVALKADSAAARVGDPLLVTARVTGEGNVKLFPRPRLQLDWGTLVAGGERVDVDSTATRVRGAKEFDWIVTPRRAGRATLGQLRYPYFNPVTERYELVASDADTLTVAAGSLARVDSSGPAAPSPLAVHRDAAPVMRPLASLPASRFLIFLAPLPALLLLAGRRRRAAPRRLAPAVRLRLCARARPLDAGALRRALVAALAQRVSLGAEAFSAPGELAHALRRAGVTGPSADDAERLLRELDGSVFASDPLAPDAGKRALAAWRRVDREALVRGAPRGGVVALFLLASLCLTSPACAQEPAAAALVARGADAYEAGQWSQARELFRAAARAEPRAPAAWNDLGAAAWAMHDTVGAVVAWQRALRLDPLSGELRDRLALVPGALGGEVSEPWPLPNGAAGGVALAAWLLAWGALFWWALRRRRWMATAAVGLLLLAASGALLERLGDARRATRDIVVVHDPGPVRTLPALAADAASTASRGQVARVVRHDGAWTHVLLDGDRDGWIEAERLVAIRDAP